MKPKVEAWVFIHKEDGARTYSDVAMASKKWHHLIEADPHAKLKAAVVRAARAMLVALAAPGRDPHGHAELDLLSALGNLDEATQKLQKVKP